MSGQYNTPLGYPIGSHLRADVYREDGRYNAQVKTALAYGGLNRGDASKTAERSFDAIVDRYLDFEYHSLILSTNTLAATDVSHQTAGNQAYRGWINYPLGPNISLTTAISIAVGNAIVPMPVGTYHSSGLSLGWSPPSLTGASGVTYDPTTEPAPFDVGGILHSGLVNMEMQGLSFDSQPSMSTIQLGVEKVTDTTMKIRQSSKIDVSKPVLDSAGRRSSGTRMGTISVRFLTSVGNLPLAWPICRVRATMEEDGGALVFRLTEDSKNGTIIAGDQIQIHNSDNQTNIPAIDRALGGEPIMRIASTSTSAGQRTITITPTIAVPSGLQCSTFISLMKNNIGLSMFLSVMDPKVLQYVMNDSSM